MVGTNTRKNAIRKYGPLAFLYPISVGIGLLSTDYVAHAINTFTRASSASTNISSNDVSEAASATTTTTSGATVAELNQIQQLNKEIQKLNLQLQQIQDGIGSTTLPLSTVVTQSPIPPLGNHGAIPQRVTSHPPVTHGSTGASSVVK